ncbi:MAG TPA: YgiQ family radical SAM protein [Candidatus Faecivivens stercoripullorum]|uniref:YgiQ family radical SAM protein n=1 Tax=Candidatus Faecivivens stercoripullorum TaxID=2840805 RepID=A0A9D1KTA6_9FIRM|nr:YgiQ family radical SAM protein [Candidatus Faecivivens stercoripullorum]
MHGFLPTTRDEMNAAGLSQLDFILITGDAYVDHPSFGTAIISRVIEAEGFSVGIIAQPDWRSDRDYTRLGRPKYGFMINSGNIDSMVAHYSVSLSRRNYDAYTAGGKPGKRPDRALTVYSKAIRRIYGPDMPIVIGGLEASLRRFAHYDYWDDSVHPSILVDAQADLLSFGMGELQTIEIVHRLAAGEDIHQMRDIRGTCYLCDPEDTPWGAAQCPDFEIVSRDKKNYCKATRIQMDNQDEVSGKTIIQRHGDKMLVQNPPMRMLTTEELDRVYDLPYMRTWHPSYQDEGGVPGLQEVEFSIAHNRGCFGACNFCSIAFHQGRRIAVRSVESVLKEARLLTTLPGFKGYIHDVGGPTANFRRPSCQKQLTAGLCKGGKKCLAPTPCPALEVDHSEYLDMLRQIRQIPGIKKVFIRSGIRYDYMLAGKDDGFLKELVAYHVSGQLKVAPEHCSDQVLDNMGKPHIEVYRRFAEMFYDETKRIGKKQYLVPYLMSSHPGSTLRDAVELSLFLKEHGMHPEQVQDFYPTPGTVSTCMFYTGMNPYTMEPVFVPRTKEEKAMQRALLQYFLPQNHRLVVKGLKMAGRTDLIGTGPGCLVPPLKEEQHSSGSSPKKGTKNARPSNRPNARTGSAAAPSQNGRRGRQKNNRKG